MMCFWHRLYFKQSGVPIMGVWLKFWHRYHFVAYILPLQATDAYILPMCRQCLYIPGWFPNLPIVTQSCVFSQSRQIHPGQPASHVMLPLSRVTCHVSCENCDSSNFKWFLWHVACVCVTHLSRVVLITGMQCVPQRGSQEDNEIDQYVSESVVFLSMTGQVHGHDITIYSPRGAINCCHLGSQLELSPFDERGLFWKTFDFGFYLTEGIWDISLFGKFVLMVCTCILLLFTLRGCVTIQTVLEQQLQLSRKPGFGWLSKTAGQTPELILKSLS